MSSQSLPAPADDYAGTLVFLRSMTWITVLTGLVLGFCSLNGLTFFVTALGFLGLGALLAGVTALIEMLSDHFHQQAPEHRLRKSPPPDPATPAFAPSHP
jgi:hypothetical protein